MDSYVIRIYRREVDARGSVVGTAERVGTEGKKAFKSVEELWNILNAEQPKITGTGKKSRKQE